ncbi:unnamed protein product [Lota lota]
MNRRGSMINYCCLAMLVLLTAGQKPCHAATCSQDIPAELVRELWRKTKDLINSHPAPSQKRSKEVNQFEKKIKKVLQAKTMTKRTMMKRTMTRLAVVVVLMLDWSLGHPSPQAGETIRTAYKEVQESLRLKEENVMTLIFDPVVTIMSSLKAQHDKMFVMNATLGVYLQIMSKVVAKPPGLEGLQETEAKETLGKLQKELIRVKKHYYHGNQDNLLQTAIDQLDNIKVDDPLVQRQALAEFMMVLHAASSVGSGKSNLTSHPV